MFASSIDKPPRLLTIRATDVPAGRDMEQDDWESVNRSSIWRTISAALVIYTANVTSFTSFKHHWCIGMNYLAPDGLDVGNIIQLISVTLNRLTSASPWMPSPSSTSSSGKWNMAAPEIMIWFLFCWNGNDGGSNPQLNVGYLGRNTTSNWLP